MTKQPQRFSTKHTPGPWVADSSPEPMHNQIVIGPSYKDSEGASDIAYVCSIALPDSRSVSLAEPRANAALIASAPELLEQLHELVLFIDLDCEYADRLNSSHAEKLVELLANARAVISKAKNLPQAS